jgi:tRNA(adenine34) deaminase
MRRRFIAKTMSCLLCVAAGKVLAQVGDVWRSFMARAFEMRRQAEAAGDQPYGAVVVKDRVIVAESPSRVVTTSNIDAHAEREALRLAQERLGTQDLSGCVLVSSSRPCPLCERAAYRAHVARMIYGENLTDGGPPRG